MLYVSGDIKCNDDITVKQNRVYYTTCMGSKLDLSATRKEPTCERMTQWLELLTADVRDCGSSP